MWYVPQLNLALAWLWILAGFIAGMGMGMNFHREDWLGGYASHRRRLYRLGHISFFGLAIINLLFAITLKLFLALNGVMAVAAWAFVLGAVFMPVCCLITAHFPQARMVFVLPVVSLIAGGACTFWEVLKL